MARLQLWERRLLLEGVERLLDEQLDVGRLDAYAVEEHVVAKVEARGEGVGTPREHLAHLYSRPVLVRHS